MRNEITTPHSDHRSEKLEMRNRLYGVVGAVSRFVSFLHFSFTFLIFHFSFLILLSSCYNHGQQSPDAWDLSKQQLDSISFSTTHHYTQN